MFGHTLPTSSFSCCGCSKDKRRSRQTHKWSEYCSQETNPGFHQFHLQTQAKTKNKHLGKFLVWRSLSVAKRGDVVCMFPDQLTDWLADWLTDWLTDGRTDGRTDRRTDWRSDRLTDRLAVKKTSYLSTDKLVLYVLGHSIWQIRAGNILTPIHTFLWFIKPRQGIVNSRLADTPADTDSS